MTSIERAEVLHQNWHMQGFTADPEQRYLYWSFTDSVVKTNARSTVIAQCHVEGGHLGDIDYRDGKLYASFLGQPEAGHAWDDWTSFKIDIFNADDLRLETVIDLPVCDQLKAIAGSPEDEYGFNAIDGVTFGKDLEGKEKMFVACAIRNGERYHRQLLLQLTLEGVYERMHLIDVGNTVFGIQNLDHDDETGDFWFSTYGPSEPYQAKETLFCVSSDLKTVRAKYRYSSPYGFHCLGGGQYLASVQAGTNGNHSGYAYACSESQFASEATEKEVSTLILEGARQ